jgi:hypothetical protein
MRFIFVPILLVSPLFGQSAQDKSDREIQTFIDQLARAENSGDPSQLRKLLPASVELPTLEDCQPFDEKGPVLYKVTSIRWITPDVTGVEVTRTFIKPGALPAATDLVLILKKSEGAWNIEYLHACLWPSRLR